jgi:hypothetical protein
MTAARDAQIRIPWFGWVGLAVFLVGGVLLVILTHNPIVPAWMRWTLTGAWMAVTVGLGIYDFFLGGASAGGGGGIDKSPMDRWTIPHTGAGLVLGLWLTPLIWVIALVVLWEVFEALPTGFGHEEVISNRLVDIGVALVGWLVVAGIVALINGLSIPWV